jgi:hypothetical protein
MIDGLALSLRNPWHGPIHLGRSKNRGGKLLSRVPAKLAGQKPTKVHMLLALLHVLDSDSGPFQTPKPDPRSTATIAYGTSQ